jgi:lipopolysaccharide transport system ATP-binding protein
MQPAIKVREIAKQYRIGLANGQRTLREAIMDTAAAPVRMIASWIGGKGSANELARGRRTDLWALRDISFDVQPGQLLGLVGPNGAGKSTLLKILSRITEPTAGRIELNGRVGSLLEVGTGFSGELTGRENTFLSGAILGMRRAEIQRQFDEIVAFAGVEEFIDTPVKRYSSGMYVRLAFAVAAHLQAEILLIDEVLAVGDLAFQRKCIAKMNHIARQSGRTIIFVSHNMAAIEALCDSCLLLENGRLILQGTPEAAVARYVAGEAISITGTRSLADHAGRRLGFRSLMRSVELFCGDTQTDGVVRLGSPLSIIVTYSHDRAIRPVLSVAVKTIYNAPVFYVSHRFAERLDESQLRSCGRIICTIDALRLMPGTYSIDLYLGEVAEDFDIIVDAISFEVVGADLNGTGRLAPSSLGPMYCSARFELLPAEHGLKGPVPLSYNDSSNNSLPEACRLEDELPPIEDASS